MQTKFYLSPDLFRHEPISVRLSDRLSEPFRNKEVFSRYIRPDGLIVELDGALMIQDPFDIDMETELCIFFPFEEKPLKLKARLVQKIHEAVGKEGQMVSLLSFKFEHLSSSKLGRLKAHDLMVQTALGHNRSARLAVWVSVKVVNMIEQFQIADLSMTGLFAVGNGSVVKGQRLNVEFLLPFQTELTRIEGVVVWAGEKMLPVSPEPVKGFGLNFEKASPQARVQLATFCAQNTLFLAL